MNTAVSSNGKLLHLGDAIAKGGEGTVYEVKNDDSLLCKVYHQPPSDSDHKKLISLVQMRTSELESASAWPLDVTYNNSKTCIGFTMHKVAGPGVIDKLSHPAEQRKAFPSVGWGFLLHVSMNLMRAASALHAHNCVIGDVNESNVFVTKLGTVKFIDTDSLQITANNFTYLCNVGKPLYTPPELQKANFRQVTRTPNHDVFGLAVLVFQLLMQGCHPFAGTPKRSSGGTIEEAISNHLFSFSPKCHSSITPPPNRMRYESLGNLCALFEQSFLSNQRPTASEWMNALDRAKGLLTQCKNNPRHQFLSHNSTCPLCELTREYFPHSESRVPTVQVDQLSIADLIKQSSSLPQHKPLESRCTEAPVSSDLLHKFARKPDIPPIQRAHVKMKYQSLLYAGIGAAIVTLLMYSVEQMFLSGLLTVISLGLATPPIVLYIQENAKEIKISAEKHNNLKKKLIANHEKKHAALKQMLADLKNLETRANSAINLSNVDLGNRASLLKKVSKELQSRDDDLTRQLSNAQRNRSKSQVDAYLTKYMIRRAEINGIGESRKAQLASFGIETALDINRRDIMRIPGFGPHLASNLMSWRKQCEHQATRRASQNPPPDPSPQIRREHANKTMLITRDLRTKLQEYHSSYAANENRFVLMAREVNNLRQKIKTH